MANKHIGGNFDDFLAEEGILEEVTATALKRIVEWQIRQEKSSGSANEHDLCHALSAVLVSASTPTGEAAVQSPVAMLHRANSLPGLGLHGNQPS